MDDSGLERRKVNEFDDGRLEFADEIQETEYTTLGDQVMPSIEEIDSLAEFTAVPISRDDFEEAWRRATTATGPFILDIAPVDWEHPLVLDRVESLAMLLLEMQPATGWTVVSDRRTVIRVTGSASAEVAPAVRRAIRDAVRVPFRIVVRSAEC